MKRHYYYIVYKANSETGRVFYDSNNKIDSRESIENVEHLIEKEYKKESIIIINFQLLRAEDEINEMENSSTTPD